MNTDLFTHVHGSMLLYPGNYLEFGSGTGELVKVLAEKFPNKHLVSVDPDHKYLSQIYGNIMSLSNVEFFNMNAQEFCNTISLGQRLNWQVDIVHIHTRFDYDTLIDIMQISEQMLGPEPGEIIWCRDLDMDCQRAIKEFEHVLGHRIVHQTQIGHDHVAYKIREH